MKIAILIPAYNEEKTIGLSIDEILESKYYKKYNPQIIVSDNNSTDSTSDIVKKYKDKNVSLISNNKMGYGANLDFGIRNTDADIIVFADADCSYPFSEFNNFVDPILEKKVDFVLGNRFTKNMEKKSMPMLNKYLGTPILTFLINKLFKTKINDCNCGMRAVLKKKYLKLNMNSQGMEFASEMIIKSAKNKQVISNVDISFRKDKRGKPPHLNRWVDGWRHLRYILSASSNLSIIYFPIFISLFLMLISFSISIIKFDYIPFHSSFMLIFISIIFAIIALSVISSRAIMHVVKDINCKFIQYLFRLEKNNNLIKTSFWLYVAAIFDFILLLYIWYSNDFGSLNQITNLIRISIFGILASYFLFLDLIISNSKKLYYYIK
tara:strand:- start:67 stop:1206 length:1140 start_codon:yes stop_codon:yes gene_type:complete